MPRETDAEFGLMLEAPGAYDARQRKFDRAVAAGVPPERAAAMCGLSPVDMGALGVFKKAGRLTKRAGRLATRFNPLSVAVQSAKFAGRGLAAATGPVRRRIFKAFFRKLIGRRARLVSWQRRRTLRPTAAEHEEARRWAVRYVKRRGLLGKLVGAALSGDVGAEPVTAALLTASIPLILALARRALKIAEHEGAPSDPRTAEPPPGPPPQPSEQPSTE
jgi:hypothetical protein